MRVLEHTLIPFAELDESGGDAGQWVDPHEQVLRGSSRRALLWRERGGSPQLKFHTRSLTTFH
jgi:hypothetical protein